MFIKLRDGTSGDLVLLVKVGSNGKAEKAFADKYSKLRAKYKPTNLSIQLGEIFGYKDEKGRVYNVYELDFETFDNLREFMFEIDRIFTKIKHLPNAEYAPNAVPAWKR